MQAIIKEADYFMKQNWEKNIAILIICQAISLFGSYVVQFAIMWYVILETKSGSYTTIYIICGFLPTFLLSPFAGVWVDRFDRKRLVILADGLVAICIAFLAFLFITGYVSIWLVFAAAGIKAMGTAVQMPCVGAIIPDLVPQEKLIRINGINMTMMSIIALFSPMASGALLGITSIGFIFLVNVITAFIAIIILIFFFKLPPKAKAEENDEKKYLAELKQGFSYIRSQKYLQNLKGNAASQGRQRLLPHCGNPGY